MDEPLLASPEVELPPMPSDPENAHEPCEQDLVPHATPEFCLSRTQDDYDTLLNELYTKIDDLKTSFESNKEEVHVLSDGRCTANLLFVEAVSYTHLTLPTILLV